jgi:hypothetical protein
MAGRKCTTLANGNTQINLAYINHLLNLNIHKLLLSTTTSISKAHMTDQISSNLLSCAYRCLFVVRVPHNQNVLKQPNNTLI